MVKVVIGSHGRLADGVRSAVKVVCGECPNVFWLNAYTEDGIWDIPAYLDGIYADVTQEDQVILISDILNGSVNKEFLKYTAGRQDSVLISGFNLPLVIEVISNSDSNLSRDELRDMIELCKNMMQVVEIPMAAGSAEQNENFWEGGD